MPNPKHSSVNKVVLGFGGQVLEFERKDFTAADLKAIYEAIDGTARAVKELAKMFKDNAAIIEEYGLRDADMARTERPELTVEIRNVGQYLATLENMVSQALQYIAAFEDRRQQGRGGNRGPKVASAREKIKALKAATAKRK